MEFVYAEMELVSETDIALARKNYIDQNEIKIAKVIVLINSGFYMLAINETIRKKHLQLEIVGKRKVELATGEIKVYDVACAVRLSFKNRQTTCRAIV